MQAAFKILAPMALSSLVLSACGSNSADSDAAATVLTKEVLANYANGVIVPTYKDLAEKATALRSLITTLKAAPTDANLVAVQEAWSATRSPWEQSEGFLFGPVSDSSYDPALDSWPLNKTDLDAVLNSGAAIDATALKSLTTNQKGFHTIEFLIFGEDSQKAASAITAREFEYLDAVAEDLKTIATTLSASWTDGVGGNVAYATTFATAGEPGNTAFPSLGSAGQTIVNSMMAICDEVANGKIQDPFAAQDPNLVESQFSFNSLKDFADNMRSVENGYNGARPGLTAPAGTSLTERVAAVDPAVDAKIKADIAGAIAAIQKIPEPFPTSLKVEANAATIKAAQDAISKLNQTLQDELLPLVSK